MRRLYLVLGLCLPVSFSVISADSVITVKGQLKDNMCTVSVGSRDFSVDLNTYGTNTFKAAGSSSVMVPFSITLENCGSAASAVKINITGSTVSNNNTLLMNTAAKGFATNIGVQVLDASQTAIKINQSSSAIASTNLKPNQTNIIPFYARMVSTTNSVGAGTVSAAANFTLQFN